MAACSVSHRLSMIEHHLLKLRKLKSDLVHKEWKKNERNLSTWSNAADDANFRDGNL